MRNTLVLALLIALTLAGCGQPSPTATPTEAPSSIPTPTPTETPAPPTETPPAEAGFPTPTPETFAENANVADEAESASALSGVGSEVAPFMGGGAFIMGTTQDEIDAGLKTCAPEDECDAEAAGDALPEHEVSVAPYQIELYEVSNAQYAEFLNALGPERHRDGCQGEACSLTQEGDEQSNIVFDGERYAPVEGAENLPVTHVSWYGAQAYCEALGRRLPSEAEWELAARGPGRNVYPWGNDFDPNLANTARTEARGLAPVDAYPEGVSPYGLFNTAGNVAEWVMDWYARDFYASEAAAAESPTGPETGTGRVVRGGSWQDPPFRVRGAHRAALEPDAMLETVGFRCAMDGWPPPEPPNEETVALFEGIENGVLEDGAPYLGSPDAPVELTEFFQFTCPHCNHFRETLHQLLPLVREGKVKVVARALRSSSQLSVPPMFISLCAAKQGAYWPIQDYFFDAYFNVEGSVAYLTGRLLERAEAFGLDMEALDVCLNDEASFAALQETLVRSSERATEKNVSGVPTVLINGEYVTDSNGRPMSGALPLETLQTAIEAALNATPQAETSADEPPETTTPEAGGN